MLRLSITENQMADGFAAALDYDGAFTPAVEAETSKIWDKVKHHVTPLEWRLHAPLLTRPPSRVCRGTSLAPRSVSWPLTPF